MPGLGHLYLGSFTKGIILMTWEIVVNAQANLNLAIYYSLLGNGEQAKQVLDLQWALLYPPFYMVTVWDAYRLAVENNRLYDLERLQSQRAFQYHTRAFYGQNMLQTRNPWMAVFWAAMLGGAGHFHNMQLLKGTVLMGWYLVVAIKSGLNIALYHTLTGEFDLAKQVVDYEWLLFWPSVYLFNIWDAYHDCVEQNKLCDEAQYYWLKRQYGPGGG